MRPSGFRPEGRRAGVVAKRESRIADCGLRIAGKMGMGIVIVIGLRRWWIVRLRIVNDSVCIDSPLLMVLAPETGLTPTKQLLSYSIPDSHHTLYPLYTFLEPNTRPSTAPRPGPYEPPAKPPILPLHSSQYHRPCGSFVMPTQLQWNHSYGHSALSHATMLP